MQTLSDIPSLRQNIKNWQRQGKSIALVPTMGNLHQGHLRLVQAAKQMADIVVVSIFVNPLQFGKNEDLDKYPRTLEADQQHLTQQQVDLLFAPIASDVYSAEQPTIVQVPSVSEGYCGASRPGHFDGVATIVCKLFNLINPDVAIFGSKDYQQLQVIRKMVHDLSFDIQIVAVDTIRDTDGLALSSRNQYLSASERQIAPYLYQTLQECKQRLLRQNASFNQIEREAISRIEQYGFQVDYLHIVNSRTLKTAKSDDTEVTILVAAFLGKTRLIDNLSVILQTMVE